MAQAVQVSGDVSGRHGPVDHLRRHWFVAVTVGELAGFAVPSLVGATALTLDVPPVLIRILRRR